MKEEKKFSDLENKKGSSIRIVLLIVIGLMLMGSIAIGISYSFWKSTTSQKSTNKITSSCLDITLSDTSGAINLQNAYPLTDAEAADLTPYQFKITNNCETNIIFNINLEVMGMDNKLNSNYVALSFNEGNKEILGNKTSVTPTYKDDNYTAVEAYNLINNVLLNKNEEKTYTLKLWINESVTTNDAMNKRFLSKINVTGELIS